MSVSITDVMAMYRAFLGREPESLEAIAAHLDCRTFDELRRTFLFSAEFLNSNGWAQGLVGRHRASSPISVESKASAEDLKTMLDRTAQGWMRLGQQDAHWSVLVDERFRRENVENNMQLFYDSGRSDIDACEAILRRNGFQLAPSHRALDFGCGVGRLSLALAPRVRSVLGVDISENHLRYARQRAASHNIENVSFTCIRAVSDISNLGQFDVIITFIVLQHNPPPVMRHILQSILEKLAPGGVAVFQLPTYRTEYAFSTKDYLASDGHDMEMHILPQKEVFEVVEASKCRPIEVLEDHMVGESRYVSQTFLVQKQS
ncbi:class I SAM-dependent methyltransferase [Labrys sp. LIt4]|uniref:class I SAM-dependent methyltransferase n=1 Tax=Labrys sp. LIt4 TaxID=2821355 RepID=UPI001AE0E63A|nr:class I SAM-dependent methyltransferase [Labrys sp. LIt4]